MMDYLCPKEIVDLYSSTKTKPRGERRAREWADGLTLSAGDRVWLPETGWKIKGAAQE